MEHLHGLLRLVDNELGEVEKNGKFRSREEIDSVYKLVDIAKDVYCIREYEDDMDDGESYGMSYGRHYDGESYARGRRGAKRDTMGRYSREYMERPMRGYSRDGKEEYKEHLRELMEDAPDESTRQSIKRMLDQM